MKMKCWTNRTNPPRGSIAWLMGALMMVGLNARAATLTVSSTADSGAGTLRDRVAAAAPGDTINFSVTGTIALTNPAIAITKDLTIVGPGQSSLTVRGLFQSGISHSFFSLFTISSGTVGISDLTLSGGDSTLGDNGDRGGGAIYMSGGTVTVASCTLSNNYGTTGFGGAIYLSSGSMS